MPRRPRPKTGALTVALHTLGLAADDLRKRMPFKSRPAAVRAIDPNSPEGREIAQRLGALLE